jgi:hypothetical protein
MQLSCYFTSYIPLTYSLYGRPGSFLPLSPARTCSRSIFSDHCYPLSLQCFYSVWIPSNVLFSTVIFVCRYCRPRSLCGSGIKEFLEAGSCVSFFFRLGVLPVKISNGCWPGLFIWNVIFYPIYNYVCL